MKPCSIPVFSLLVWLMLPPGLALATTPGSLDLPTVNSPKLSLRDALEIAARNSVTLKQRQADVNIATAATRSATAQLKPLLSTTTYGAFGDSSNILTTSPGVSPQNIFVVPPHGFADQNLMLMVPLLTGGRLGNNVTAARKLDGAAQQTLQAARLSVTETVTEDYATAALQQALVNVAQARLTAEDEQVRVTQEKVTAGRSAPVDLLREQVEQADARQALLAAQNEASLALVSLKTALGVSQESSLALSDTLDGLAGADERLPFTLPEALRQAESHRPEMAGALQRVEAAQAGVNAAQGAYSPQVYGVAMGDAMTGQGVGRVGYTIGLTASLPLNDGGQRRANVAGAKATLDRARADALQIRQEVDQEMATAWLTWQSAAAQIGVARVGVMAAQQGYDLAALRYNAGKSVTSERLDALAALVQAQGALGQAKAGLLIARAKLAAAGGL